MLNRKLERKSDDVSAWLRTWAHMPVPPVPDHHPDALFARAQFEQLIAMQRTIAHRRIGLTTFVQASSLFAAALVVEFVLAPQAVRWLEQSSWGSLALSAQIGWMIVSLLFATSLPLWLKH